MLMKPSTMDDEKFDSDADYESSDASSGEWFKPKPEPQWDVDSFDGREYESDPDDRNYFPDDKDYEEIRAEKRMFFASKGIVPNPLSGNCLIQDEEMESIWEDNVTVRKMMEELANVCIKKHNLEKKKTVELVNIVRVYVTGGAERKNYITFMAREYPNGPLVEYQAKVMRFINDDPPYPVLCRPSPISTI